jgi:hypothetical protein
MGGTGAEGGAGADGDPSAVADALRGASFARLVSHADGDALAAAGALTAALDARGVPYQVSAARTAADATRRLTRGSGDDAATVAIGFRDPTADAALPTAPSLAAHTVVAELGADPDPVRCLAGHVAGGADLVAGGGADLVERAGLEASPGVAVPTADLADGLAHATLLHAPWSGDPERARALLAELGLPADLDADARRRVASLVAVDATAEAPPRAAEAVERALRPLRTPDLAFETLEGYADVLECVARGDPGTAIALVLGHDVREAALEEWRAHAADAHRAVAGADPARYSGVVVADASDGPVWTVARLLRDFRSPEPAALAVGDGRAALATTDRDARATLADALEADAGRAGGRSTLAYAETSDVEALTDAVVSAL